VLISPIIVLFLVNLVVLIAEIIYACICALVGSTYVKFYSPIPSVKRPSTYINSLLDQFSNDSVSRTEEFVPPFVFGYRKYFFARIVGWRGTWASFLKQYRRRVRSSIFEWGYKNRVPSWYYYTIRGGLRIQIVIPSHFRRVSGSSYNSPMWFYSFPARPKRRGFRGDEWDHYFHSPFRGYSNYRRLYRLYRRIERPRTRYFYLSNWLEKCAPMMPTSYRKSDNYSFALDPRASYAYSNSTTFSAGVSKVMHRHPTHLGMKQAVLYVDTTAHDMLRPKLIRMFRKFGPDPRLPYIHTLASQRKVTSIGNYIIIDKEALKLKIFLLRYGSYTTIPSREYNGNYDYAKFMSLYWYHTFVEFLSIMFESLYIYPFEFGVTPVQIVIKPEFTTSYFTDLLLEWVSGSGLLFTNPVICLVGMLLYFSISLIGLQFGSLLIRVWIRCFNLFK
jgi:hypothetical protein